MSRPPTDWSRTSPVALCVLIGGMALAGIGRVPESTRAAERSDSPRAPSSIRDALAAMPFVSPAPLARSNAVRRILEAFRPSPAVHALVILPGAIDDFHLVHRNDPLPPMAATTLAEALDALTNATAWRVTCDATASRVLIHTAAERSAPGEVRAHPATTARLRQRVVKPPVKWIDATWPVVQPALENGLGLWVRPAADEAGAGHFERVNLAGQGLTQWEWLEAVALATGTRLVVERREARFER